MTLASVGRWALVAILIGTAAAKLLQLVPPRGDLESLGGPYGIVVGGEIVAALLLVFGSATLRRAIAMLIVAVVAGAGVVTLWTALFAAEPVLCRCVGPWRLSLGHEMLLQGITLGVAGLTLATAESDPAGPRTA